MKKSFFMQKVLPHIVAVFVFVLVVIIFYSPIIFGNKVLSQHDILQGAGSAAEIVEFRDKTGEEALWTNSMFSGMPAYLISVHWTADKVLRVIQDVYYLGLPNPAGENLSMFLGFYILLLIFGVRPYVAMAGALAYGLSSFFIVSIGAGHMWKIRAIAYAPLVLAGIHLLFKRKFWIGFALTALSLAMELYANHFQITYYLFIVIFIYGIVNLFYYIKEKRFRDFLKPVLVAVCAGVLALTVNFGKIWATYEYGKFSIRGKSELTAGQQDSQGLDREYAFRWSVGKWETLTLLIPNLYGGASGQYNLNDSETEEFLQQNNVPPAQVDQYLRGLLGYWGDQPGTAGPSYIGAVVCFFFILGFFFVDRQTKWWLVSCTVLGILLSWGSNFGGFNYLVFDVVPGYNKFRAVSMTIFIPILSMILMASMGVENFLKEEESTTIKRKLFMAGAIAGALLLIVLLFPSTGELQAELPAGLKSAVKEDRASIVRTEVMRSVFFVLVAFLTLIAYLLKKINTPLTVALVVLVIGVDLTAVDKRYLNEEDFIKKREQTFLEPTPADQMIQKDDDIHFRVFDIADPFNDARTSAFHASIGGYHGAKIRRYSDLIERYLANERQRILEQKKITRENTQVLSALNTKYLIAGTAENAVIRNPFALGNAWFVRDVSPANSPDEELEKIGKVNLENTAVIDESKFDIPVVNYDSTSTISLVEYQPNYLKYQARTESPGLAVFSEIYYPAGWEATIDGKPAPILRADYILRALAVPEGEHTIEFTFKPQAFYVGNQIAFIGVILLLICCLITVFLTLRQSLKRDSL